MNGVKRHRAAASFLALSFLCGGCGRTATEPTAYTQEMTLRDSYTDAALGLDYESPEVIPATLVDQVGYETTRDKKVLFAGTHIPEEFAVCESESGEVIYTGAVTMGGGAFASGDFSALQTAGEYYIQTNLLGVSYAFSIGDDVYQDAFSRAQKQFYLNRCGTSLTEQYAYAAAHSVCHTTAARLQEDASVTMDVTGGWHLDEYLNRDVLKTCHAIDQMLLAYELRPDAFTDEVGIPESGNDVPDILDETAYGITWLLKMQDEATGGVYAAVTTDIPEGGNAMIADTVVTPITTEATGAFAATLAHFSHLYQSVDETLATQCVQASDRAFRLYRAAKGTDDAAIGFHAACELYRATKDARFAQAVEAYFEKDTYIEELFAQDDFFYGAAAYLTTGGAVDKEACGRMMEALMEEAREIAASVQASSPAEGSADAAFVLADAAFVLADAALALEQMRTMAVVNYVLNIHEYSAIIEEQAHFLMGMNPLAVNLVTPDTEHAYADAGLTGLLAEPLQAAQLIFLLSAMQ